MRYDRSVITAPPGFLEMERTVVLHRPPAPVGTVARVGGTTAPPRPSLVVARRRAHDELAPVAARMCDELARMVTGTLTCDALTFDDGAEGRVIALTFDVLPTLAARQWIALRCDAEWTTTGTYTAPVALANEAEALLALRSLGRAP